MSRKFAFLFDDSQRYHSVCQLIDETTCRDHFSAGLNGGNGEVIANLLDSLIEGKLNGLTDDDHIKELWEKAGYKLEHLTPGAIAIVATGRSFNVAQKSGLPRSQSKVFGEVSMILKAAIWERIGSSAKHLNEKELAARSEVKQSPAKIVDSNKPAKSKATKTKAAKVKPGPSEVRAEAA